MIIYIGKTTYEDSYLRNFSSPESKIIREFTKTWKLKNSKRKSDIYFKFLRFSPYYWNKTLMKNLRKFEQSEEFSIGRIKKNIHTDKCPKNGPCSYPESKKFTIDFEGVMFLSEAWLHPPQEGAYKKHISRSCQGCGRVDLDSNISSQIDTIPQTSVVRKPSGAPFHLLPPVLSTTTTTLSNILQLGITGKTRSHT